MTETKINSKQSPSSQSVKGLNGLVFCLSDVRHGIGPLLTIYLKTVLNWDPGKIGIALAMPDISAMIFQVPAGLIVDETHHKKAFIALPCVSILLACLLITWSPFFAIIIGAQLLMGLAISFISPTLGAITLGLFGKERFPKRISINEMLNHAGNVCSALLAGLTGYLFGSQCVFYWVMFFSVSSLIFLTLIRTKEINYRVARELPEDVTQQAVPKSELLKRKGVILFNLFLVIYYMANGSQMVLVGQKVSNLYPDASSLFIAGCMLVAELTMIVVSFGMGYAAYCFGRKWIFMTAYLMLPIRALLFSFIENPYYLIGIQVLDGLAAGIIGVIAPVINTDLGLGTGRFNFLQGLSALAISTGVVTSMILGGFVAKNFGFPTAFVTLACIGIAGLLVTAIFLPETKKANGDC